MANNDLSLHILSLSVCGLLLLYSCSLFGSDDEPLENGIGYTDKDGVLYLIDPASGSVRTLVDKVEMATNSFRWSPDGNRIAYVNLYGNQEAYQVYVMNANGTDQHVISLWERNGHLEPCGYGAYSPVWSPDGKSIAFTRCLNCELGGLNSEVFIVDLDTTHGLHEVRLTNNLLQDTALDWSPDGRKILFESTWLPGGIWDRYYDTYVMNPDGSQRERVLTSDSTFSIGSARYSPDGNHITFIARRFDSNEIYTANADGSDVLQVTDNALDEYNPSWSNDGKRLAFWAERARYGGHIYIINIDGTGQQKITTGEAVYGPPEWRPHQR